MDATLSEDDMARTALPWEELTEEQRKNRIKNEKAKKRREKPSNIVEMPRKKSVVPDSPSSNEEAKPGNPWSSLLLSYSHPQPCFLSGSVLLISGYLCYQFSLYSDVSTGLIVEFLAVIFAALSSVSPTRLGKMFSSICLGAVIFYSSVVLHDGLQSDRNGKDYALNAMKSERSLIVSQIEQINKDISNLPSTYVSKKQELRDMLPGLTSKLEGKSSEISDSSVTAYDYSSLMIRILCMLANMLLIHRLIQFFRSRKV